jgi:pyroglutamyl-peptidase
LRPRVLVTGFGPFPGAPRNPSQLLVKGLTEGLAVPSDHQLHLATLPTRYDAAREAALRLHRRLKPDIALHFGFSLRAAGFTLERLAENRLTTGRLDAAGARSARATVSGVRPLLCASTLPLEAIRAALEECGLPVAFSDDAGAYVCNLVFYAAATRRAGGPRPAMAGFIHIPLTAEMRAGPAQRARAGRKLVAMSRADLVEGARLIVATCVDEWLRMAGAEPFAPAKKEPLARGKRPSFI